MKRSRIGNYYANGHEYKNGRRYGVDVARQAPTLRAACRALDGSGLTGYVSYWSESTQQKVIVAELDEAGNWWAPDSFRGILVALDPYAAKASAYA